MWQYIVLHPLVRYYRYASAKYHILNMQVLQTESPQFNTWESFMNPPKGKVNKG